MIDQLHLFDPGPGVLSSDEVRGLSPDQKRTARRRALLEAGVHPATKLPLVPERGTCADCALFLVRTQGAGRRWFKCARAGVSFGPATDIRKGWPACTAFEPRV